MAYQIIDELEVAGARKTKAPWPPRALFFLTILFAPLGGVLGAFNWGRLGEPQKRGPWLLLALLLGWIVPVVVILNLVPFAGDSHSRGMIISLASVILAFAFRMAQSSRQQWHEMRGGKTANAWPIYVFLAFWLALLFVPSWLAAR